MLVGFLTPATCDRVLCRFQLHNYASETLREGVVNVSRHSISFFQNGGLPALLGEFIELNCQHRLVRERVEQMGGKLTIASSRGKGTKVVVALPYNHEPTL